MSRRAPAAVFVFGFAILIFHNSYSQDFKAKPPSAPQIDEELLAKQLQKRNEQDFTQQAIEGVIDPATYVVGPGDVLKINFWGPTADDLGLSVVVTPEGKIIIPTVGVVEADRKTLQQVQEETRRLCATKYDSRNVKVTIHLTKLRTVRAYIFGEVKGSGVYTATSIGRVSYYLSEAKGFTEWADERHVQLRHLHGGVDTLDMTRLYEYGDITQDPYVQGGDMIYVPRIELTDQTVFVEGDMLKPGPHKIMEGETLLEFLHRVKALTRTSDLNGIVLVRGKQPPLHVNFLANGAANADLHQMPLQHGDRIFVPPIKEFVYVHGAVKSPGSYPFVVGYKAGDYAGLAGGTVESGNLRSVRVIHQETGKSEAGPDKEVQRGDTVVVPVSARTTFGQFLTFGAQTGTIVLAVIAAVNALNTN